MGLAFVVAVLACLFYTIYSVLMANDIHIWGRTTLI